MLSFEEAKQIYVGGRAENSGNVVSGIVKRMAEDITAACRTNTRLY